MREPISLKDLDCLTAGCHSDLSRLESAGLSKPDLGGGAHPIQIFTVENKITHGSLHCLQITGTVGTLGRAQMSVRYLHVKMN